MGEAARRHYMRRSTPEQRFDEGLDLCQFGIDGIAARLDLPATLSREERARRLFAALRSHGE